MDSPDLYEPLVVLDVTLDTVAMVVSTITEPKVPLIVVQRFPDKSSIVPDKLETLKLDESVLLS